MTTPVPTQVDLSKYVDNALMSDRPHVRGRRVPVWLIAAYADDHTIASIAHQFTLSEEEVLAALLYYREHQAEIEAQVEEDKRMFDENHAQQDPKWKQWRR
jgi:uncharacterized protein (DUF433 family)